jgi:RNA polymerase sigma-70 factor, ECF subfamily
MSQPCSGPNVPAGGRPGEDAAALSAIADGDMTALRTLYERHAPGVLALSKRVMGDTPLAEAAVQEVFLELWRGPHLVDLGRGSLETHIRISAHRHAVRAVRMLRSADGGRSRSEQQRAAAPSAITALPADLRTAVHLAYLDGHTYREVASILGIAESAAATRLRTALQRPSTETGPMGQPMARTGGRATGTAAAAV